MREYCLEQLTENFEGDEDEFKEIEQNYSRAEYESYVRRHLEEEYAHLSLDELIGIVLEEGETIIENQMGWAVRYVVRGENLRNY
jgi:hypothetical protein